MSSKSSSRNVPAAEVIDLLIQGNSRFVSGLRSVETFVNKMKDLAQNGQFPFCTLVTCSDSRIPIELIFDRGLGDLFVVRSFGNVVDPLVTASIEYAALNFNSEVIVVMGHSRSGAVRTTLEQEKKAPLRKTPALQSTIEKIRTSLNRVRVRDQDYAPLERKTDDPETMERWEKFFQQTSQENVRQAAREIVESSLILQERVAKQHLFIVPAIYEIDSGQVVFEMPAALASRLDRNIVELEAFRQGKLTIELLDRSLKQSKAGGSK